MRFVYIIVMLLLFAVEAKADEFLHKGKDMLVQGIDAACTAAIPHQLLSLAAVSGIPLDKLKNARVIDAEGTTPACWIRLTPTRVFVMDARGNFGYLEVGVQI